MFDDKTIMLDGFSTFFSIFHHHFKRGAARPPAASSCLQDTEHAVATATDALNAASAGIEDIPEESRNDASRARFVAQWCLWDGKLDGKPRKTVIEWALMVMKNGDFVGFRRQKNGDWLGFKLVTHIMGFNSDIGYNGVNIHYMFLVGRQVWLSIYSILQLTNTYYA